jgi:pSer/pThr/pTyr-binding forkhead associated (FHA) protein
VFCENCGASLIGKLPLDTKSLEGSSEEEKVQIGIDVSVLTDVKVQGQAVFREGDILRLDIDGSPEPIKFKPKPETIFGRRDPATGAMPDVDLTPFAGYRMGVSRRHAAIRSGDDNNLDIWDLGSSNGTFLNGQRLSAHRPYRLRDGDELRLGQMVVHIYFEEKSAEAPTLTQSAPGAPSAGESPAPQPSAAKPEKVEASTDAAVQPSAIDAASVAPDSSTSSAGKATVPLHSPEKPAAPIKPDSPAGQTNSAALAKAQQELKEILAASSEASKPADSPEAAKPAAEEVEPPKPPENEEKRD